MKPWVELAPDGPARPVVVSIPHTGVALTDEVAARFASSRMRSLPMTDWHLHRLYDFLPALGITMIHARFSRLVIDLNRPPDGGPLYPGRFETSLVPLETFDGEPIFREPPGPQAIEALRIACHAPYHERLGQLLDGVLAEHGRVVLIDAHSVASRANRLHAALEGDIYLGDADGTSCESWLTGLAAEEFRSAGLDVRLNDPYKGGYITRHYGGRPGVDALQIEMCQRLYMNEDDAEDRVEESWNTMKQNLVSLFSRLLVELERN